MEKRNKTVIIISVLCAFAGIIFSVAIICGIYLTKNDVNPSNDATVISAEGNTDVHESEIQQITPTADITGGTDVVDSDTAGTADSAEEFGDIKEGEQDDDPDSKTTAVQIKELPYFPLEVVNEQVIIGRSGWLFYAGKNNVESYNGSNLMSDDELEKCAETLAELTEVGKACNKEIRFMVCPEKEAIYPEYYPTVDMYSEKTRADIVYEYMQGYPDVYYIYPKQALIDEKRNLQLYYTYDSHWNSAGGYIGAKELLSTLDIHMDDIKNMRVRRVVSLSGDLLLLGNMSGDDNKKDVDFDLGYKPDTEIISAPETHAVEQTADYITDAKDDRHFVMVGDSFNVQMMNYICREYAHCSFVHAMTINGKEARNMISDADILVLETVERNLGDLPAYADSIRRQLEAD